MKRNKAIEAIHALIRDVIKERDLKDFAHIVIRERRSGIEQGIDVEGHQMKKLNAGTVRRKRKSSISASTPLVNKGHLKTSRISSSSDEVVKIVPAKSRRRILKYHEDGNGVLPKRSTWGVYPEAARKIEREFRKRLLKYLKNAIKR